MNQLFAMKKAQQAAKAAQAAAAAEAASGSGSSDGAAAGPSVDANSGWVATSSSTRHSAVVKRIQTDLDQMEEIPGAKLTVPDPDNPLRFAVTITPDEGFWARGVYLFDMVVPLAYPVEPPKVTCNTQIYHPNIDLEGHVCLNILRKDWTAVLGLQQVIFGLVMLFQEPNPDDPLNIEAAQHFIRNLDDFKRTVDRTMRGGRHFGKDFPRLI